MDRFVSLMQEFLDKAILMTEAVIRNELDSEKFNSFANNRERLLHIIHEIAGHIEWDKIEASGKTEINRRIEYLNRLDDMLIQKMMGHQAELKKEIEKTFRQREKFKGYNLSDVK